MKMFAVSAILLLLTGCMASMPNQITPATSNFDGSKSLTMAPAFIYESADTWSYAHFQLGLFWSSKFKDSILITAKLPNDIRNINSHEGLQFNVDGKVTKLSTDVVYTQFDADVAGGRVYTESSKPFSVSKQFIQSLLDAKSVKIKLITNKGALVGDFKADKPGAAIRGFKDFMQQFKKS